MKLRGLLIVPLLAMLVLLLTAPGPAVAKAGCDGNEPASNLTKKKVRDVMNCLVNKERNAKNVKGNKDLDDAGQKHSEEMKSCGLSHQCRGEPPLTQRVKRSGYSNSPSTGEVVAAYSASFSPSEIFNAIMNSSQHREIVLRASYDHLGVGISIKNNVAYYTLVLAHK